MKLYISENHSVPLVVTGPTVALVYSIESVNYTSTYNEIDWDSMTQAEKDDFTADFLTSTATALGVSEDDITIHGIIAGSAIVDATVYVSEGSSVTVDDIETTLNNNPPTVNGKSATIANIKKGFAAQKGQKPKTLARSSIVSPTNIDATSAVLNWTVEDNGEATVQKYEIFANNQKVGEVSADVTTFTVNDLLPDTDYVFKLRKVTSLGNVDSTVATVHTPSAAIRKLYTFGTSNVVGHSGNSTKYMEAVNYNVDIAEIYPSRTFTIVKSTDGLYYSMGTNNTNNSLGRLDVGGNALTDSSDNTLVQNDVLNNAVSSGINIRNITVIIQGCIVLTTDRVLKFYGKYLNTTSNTTLTNVALDNALADSGWILENVVGGWYNDIIILHYKKDGKDKIVFEGHITKTNLINLVNNENSILNTLLETRNVLELRGLNDYVKIKLSGENGIGESKWFVLGNTFNSNLTGTSWLDTNIGYTEWLAAGGGDKNYAKDPMELNLLNDKLAVSSNMLFVKSYYYFTGVYDLTTGVFYSMTFDASLNPPYSVGPYNKNQFEEVPEMNLNNIGVAGGLLSEVQGEFDTFISGYNKTGYLFTYVT
tara:strand:+ start:2826 stop:4607 length:1782 start_codon:yes stop_codon:yes gene_type:complete